MIYLNDVDVNSAPFEILSKNKKNFEGVKIKSSRLIPNKPNKPLFPNSRIPDYKMLEFEKKNI